MSKWCESFSVCRLVIVILLTTGTIAIANSNSFTNVQIEEQFRAFLSANYILMEMEGAKVVKFNDGSRLLIAVGCTDVREKSPTEQIRRRTVARAKAQKYLVAQQSGFYVSTCAEFSEKTVTTIENGKETWTSLSEFLEITTARANAMIPGLPVIGTWMSRDGGLFYLAIGKLFMPEDLNK